MLSKGFFEPAPLKIPVSATALISKIRNFGVIVNVGALYFLYFVIRSVVLYNSIQISLVFELLVKGHFSVTLKWLPFLKLRSVCWLPAYVLQKNLNGVEDLSVPLMFSSVP